MEEASDERTPSTAEARGRARREQVLAAAAAVFSRRGFHGSSVAELAKQAGMSVGHIYHYFENKDAIIEALVDREMARRPGILAELAGADGVGPGVLDRLAGEVQRVLDREQAALWLETLAEAARNPRIAVKLRSADAIARERLARGVAARLPGLGERELSDRVEAIAAIFQGLAVRAVYQPGLDRDTVVRTIRLALRELLGGPDTSASPRRPESRQEGRET